MQAAFLAFIVACIWGLNPIFEKLSLRDATPFSVITIRFIFTSVILTLIMIVFGKTNEIISVDSRSLFWILLSGLLGGLIGLFIFFIALKKGDASQIVPIVATFPMFTALYAYLFLGENITFTRMFGIIFVVLGAILINWSGVAGK